MFSINYSFITDTILHRFFRDLESYYAHDFREEGAHAKETVQPVRELIRQRAAEVLLKHRNDNIMLISHSMGTIIAYDVLTLHVPKIRINTFVTLGSPLGLPIVKSKIAAEKKTLLKHFRKLRVPGGVKQWYNFADLEDYVALNYDLSDDFFPSRSGVMVNDFIVNNDYEIHGKKNPHKSFGYLRTPEFAAVMVNFLESKDDRRPVRIISLLRNFINEFKFRSRKMTGS